MIEVARRGRPSATTLSAALERSRAANADLRDELRSERLESRDLAARARDVGRRLEALGIDVGSPAIVQSGLELSFHANRFLRQRAGVR